MPHHTTPKHTDYHAVREAARQNPAEQSVIFVLRLHWNRLEGPQEYRDTVYDGTEGRQFEDMMLAARKERKRRKLRDQATRAEYKMVLTDIGRKILAERAEQGVAPGHLQKAIDEDWMNIFG